MPRPTHPYLPTPVRGQYLYLYLVVDVWSRRIVGWRVHERESPDLAAQMIAQILQRRMHQFNRSCPSLRQRQADERRDDGVDAEWLGIIPSFSRPHVSDDNPYSEALFRTLKYTPAYPRYLFACVAATRAWVTRFVGWYNDEHRHSGIRFVTPSQRHFGQEGAILARRRALYARAQRKKPERWSRATRNWNAIEAVVLHPDRIATVAE